VVFVFFIGAFTAREVQAQQLPQAQQHTEVTQYTVVIDGNVIEREAGTSSVEAPLVNSTPPPGGQRDSGGVGSEPTSVPDPMTEPVPQSKSVPRLPAGSSPAPDLASGGDPGSDPVPTVDLVPEPVAFEENNPPLAYTEEPSLLDPETEEAPSPSSLDVTVSSAKRDILESIRNALQDPADRSPFPSTAEDEDSSDTVLGNLFAGREASHALAGEGTEHPSPIETGSPSKDTPQPSPPVEPPVGSSSFSLSGGQMGPGSGVAPLLMCILVTGLILLRRDDKLSRVFCKLPKPSSALLLPLERPG
jgi:hypothetical protein